MIKSKRVLISGSIQAVFFKQFIKDEAEKVNVRGHVRGLEDGKIEVFLEGDNVAVDNLVTLCRSNSRYAQVRSLELKDEKFQDSKDFKILKF